MKKTIFLLVLVLIMGICTGCGKENTEIENSCMKEQTTSESSEDDEIHLDDELNIDFTCDYSESIKEDVDDVVADSTSLQEELTNMEKVTQKYTPLAEAAQTQGEMNVAAQWLYTIWDTELNNLWSRLSSSADRRTKEKLLAEQRNWIDLKEEVTLLNIGSREENGQYVSASTGLLSGGNYKKQGVCSCKRAGEDKRGRLCYAGSFRKVRNLCR